MSHEVTGVGGARSPLDWMHAFDPDFLPRFRDALIRHLATTSPAIYRLAEPFLNTGAKHLRPFAVRLAGSFGHAAAETLIDLAVVVELVHTASLYHDDVIDQSSLRRGKIALHRAHGRLTAVLVGAHLMHLATHIVHGIELASRDAETRLHEILASGAADICRGEWTQSMNTGNLDTDEALYMEIIELKTARLFEVSFKAGALAASGPVDELGAFGRHFGLLYQIADDMRDVLASAEELRRDPGSDLGAGTYTLPIIRAVRAGDTRLPDLLSRRSGSLGPTATADCLAMLAQSDATEYSLEAAIQCGARAKGAIVDLPRTAAYDALVQMVDDVVLDLTTLVRRRRSVG